MKIQFIGATHEVTGSCTLLEVGGRHYLVDCGMEQGVDVFQNVPLPVSAEKIEAVFLTHAHIDYSGMLPKLCRDGFSGPIYATEATCNLCSIMHTGVVPHSGVRGSVAQPQGRTGRGASGGAHIHRQ